MSPGRAVGRPFRAVGRGVRRIPWPLRILLGLLLLAALPVAAVATVYFLPPRTAVALVEPALAWLSDAPPLPGDLEPVSERSVLLAADGSELAVLFDEVNRVRVTREEIPDVVIDALLAAEDNRFYEHPGINHRAIMRAAWANLRSGDIEQGGSTLTQQLVKNVYLDAAQTARRKLTEAWYALELEDRLSKDEIIERYLNETFFGQGAYGIGAAAELYFDTPLEDLDAAQAATLIGIVPAPSRRDPVVNPDAALAARDRVLDRMVVAGRLDESAARAAQSGDLGLDLNPPPPPAEPFFVAYVRDRLLRGGLFDAAFGDDPVRRERLVYGGGLRIHTTLDPRLQELANDAIAETMGPAATSPLATLVTVEPGSGAVRAMAVGPKEFGPCPEGAGECERTMVNPTVPGLGGSGRQPGSAFKPFVLTAALLEGLPPGWQERTAAGDPIEGCDDSGRPYAPENYSEDPGIKAMPEALRVSNNVYHAKLAGRLGPEALVAAAETAGLRGGILPEECSVALGSGSAFPLAMARAFATFAGGGQRCAPMVVTRIEFGAGLDRDDVTYQPSCEQAFDPDVAAQVTALLREPVERGTATAARLDRPVAGKTGTTDDYRDAWFVGFVPQLSTAAWVGYEQPRPMRDVLGVPLVTGGSIPARLWATYMGQAVEGMPVAAFDPAPPPELVTLPDFRDAEADDLLEDHSEDFTLHLETKEVRHYADRGTVVRQRPKPGTRVEAGTLVTLRVSNGLGRPPRLPDVVGLPEARARRILERAGYVVVVETETRRRGPGDEPAALEGTVLATTPPAGTRLEPEEEVVVTVVTYDADAPDEPEPGEPGEPSPAPTPTRSPRPGREPDPDPSETPGPSPARGLAKFGQIVANPAGNDTATGGGEYVTVVVGRETIDVSGWTVEYAGGGTLRIGDGYRLSPGGSVAVYTGPGRSSPPDRYFNGLRRQVLRNDGGTLILRDRFGREVTRRTY